MDYEFKVGVPEGLHARPCAKIIEILKPFTPLSFHCKGKTVDTLSILELLLLQIERGEAFTLSTSAPLPSEVLEDLQQVFGG